MKQRLAGGLALAAALTLASGTGAPLFAQSITHGSIEGAVLKADRSPLSGARVIISEAATGVTKRYVTAGDGSFRAFFLVPGDYSVS